MSPAPNSHRDPTPAKTSEQKRPAGKGGRPRKGEEERLSAHILHVAFQLFATQGFAATSIEQVAATSGVGRDTIYRRYASKAELLQAASMAARHRILAQLDMETVPEASVLERLRSYARQLLTVSVTPDLVALKRISFHAMMTTGEQPGDIELSDPLRARLVQLVVQAQEAGHLRAGDPGFLATQLFYAVAARPSIDAMMKRENWASLEAQDSFFAQAWDYFCRGACR